MIYTIFLKTGAKITIRGTNIEKTETHIKIRYIDKNRPDKFLIATFFNKATYGLIEEGGGPYCPDEISILWDVVNV